MLSVASPRRFACISTSKSVASAGDVDGDEYTSNLSLSRLTPWCLSDKMKPGSLDKCTGTTQDETF
eukprot:m.194158 g.194158  ORF g.194158 m.194158 type:complete len:66 (+) comp16787_c9_seq2:1322-1519(+)